MDREERNRLAGAAASNDPEYRRLAARAAAYRQRSAGARYASDERALVAMERAASARWRAVYEAAMEGDESGYV